MAHGSKDRFACFNHWTKARTGTLVCSKRRLCWKLDKFDIWCNRAARNEILRRRNRSTSFGPPGQNPINMCKYYSSNLLVNVAPNGACPFWTDGDLVTWKGTQDWCDRQNRYGLDLQINQEGMAVQTSKGGNLGGKTKGARRNSEIRIPYDSYCAGKL
jgi:hypothetical protein